MWDIAPFHARQLLAGQRRLNRTKCRAAMQSRFAMNTQSAYLVSWASMLCMSIPLRAASGSPHDAAARLGFLRSPNSMPAFPRSKYLSPERFDIGETVCETPSRTLGGRTIPEQ